MDVSKKILSDIAIFTKYARYRDDLNRRENWEELVERNKQMHLKKYPYLKTDIEQAYELVLAKKVLPSMRSLQFAGKAIEVTPNRIYNCAFTHVDDIHVFSEAMFLLLGGTGLGFSVQKRHVDKLPSINTPKGRMKRYVIDDSIEGWADSILFLMKCYFRRKEGVDNFQPVFDFSNIRAKGARLITSGGKAPGPQPLKECLEKIELYFQNFEDGDKLQPIDCHDIICFIAEAVLAGGIRRAALISLFDKDDEVMMKSKSKIDIESASYDYNTKQCSLIIQGKIFNLELSIEEFEQLDETDSIDWWKIRPERARANNSVILDRETTTKEDFDGIYKITQESGSGEPGILWTNDMEWGTNPCAEIALRSCQFCNLTEINASNIEDQQDFEERVVAATLIGTLQAGYTDFHYLRDKWRQVTEEEALLGVGMTGIASNSIFKEGIDITAAAQISTKVNQEISMKIGINEAARITTVKPSGTSSLVLGTSSGVHAWFDEFYIRRMRLNKNESIYQYLAANHPNLVEDELFRPETTAVLSVPQKAPENASLRSETAIQTLTRVKRIFDEWILPTHSKGVNTHNVSTTVNIDEDRMYDRLKFQKEQFGVTMLEEDEGWKENEWFVVREWMWSNRNYYNGISLLPFDGGNYQQTPFESCSEETYEEMLKSLKSINLDNVIELTDETDLTGELACVGGACEI